MSGRLLTILLILAGSSFLLTDMHHSGMTQEDTPENELAEAYDAFAFDLLKKQDPETGRIPDGALMSAYRTLKARGYYRHEQGNTRSEDGWQQVNDYFPSLAITKITYDPNNTNVFYFCTGEGWFNADAVRGAGIFKSTDGGETWFQLPSTDSAIFQYCQDIDVHPITGDIYVATRSGGLQRSTNGGESWQKVLGSGAGSGRNSICDVEITSDGGVFVGIGIFETDGIYYSANGDSATFSKQTVGLPSTGYYRIELAVSKSDPDIAYAIPCSTSFRIQGIYRTDDRGATWQATNLPGDDNELAARQAWYDLVIEVSPEDPNLIIAGGLNIWRSTDGGGTWDQLTRGSLDSSLLRYMHVDQHAAVFRNQEEVYFGNDGGIYKTLNFSADNPTIYSRNDGYNVTQYYAHAMSGQAGSDVLIGGTQDNGSLLAYNPGLSSFKPVSGADGAFCAINSINEDIFYTTTQYRRLFRFDNGGFEMPDTLTNPNVTDDNLLFINPIEIDPVDPENLYMASNAGLWRLINASTADTSGWEKACTYGGTISAIAVSTNPPNLVFIGRNVSNAEPAVLYDASFVDGGSSPFGLDPSNMIPDATGFGSTRYCSSIAVDVNDANHLIVTYSNYNVNSIWETTNALSGSPTWTSVEGDFPDVPVNWAAIHPGNPNVAYIATELGVFYTDQLNGEATVWIPCTYFPVVRTDMIRIRPEDGRITVATHGRGLWDGTIDPGGVSNDIIWQERGPNNVGGRTRAIMIDPNDPTGQTIWAGSVSGGLWKTTSIDAITAVDDKVQQISSLLIHPNPVHGNQLSFTCSAMSGRHVKAGIYSISTGQLVAASGLFTDASGKSTWGLANTLAPGAYLLVVGQGADTYTARFISN